MTTSRALVNSNNTSIDLGSGPAAAGSEVVRTAWSSAEAVLEALQPWVAESATTIEIDSLEVVRIGASEAILVKVLYGSDETTTDLVGAALIEGDVSAAATRAMLNALNRKLALIRSQLVLDPAVS